MIDKEQVLKLLGKPVGIAGSMPGTSGFTMSVFMADDVPKGTSLYTESQLLAVYAKGAEDMRERNAKMCDAEAESVHNSLDEQFIARSLGKAIRAKETT